MSADLTTPGPSEAPRSSTMATPETPRILSAWEKAMKIYRKWLSQSELERIKLPVGPEDIVKDIQLWEEKQKNGPYSKLSSGVLAFTTTLKSFNGCLDVMAQGTPSPGCLLWASIRFVLQVVHNKVEEYARLCKALVRVAEFLPHVDIYNDTFADSALLSDCVTSFYVALQLFLVPSPQILPAESFSETSYGHMEELRF
ncbi:MAG: hypothetical protein M4579_006811 [Chaenotheca gracillima]|nr:MAG: hypothetical protein M4579_006811 [Chaenotheca gracillima]